MPLAPIFQRCFAPLIGRPCWQVQAGHGSFITLEFGKPHLAIREPYDSTFDASPKVRELSSQRKVTVRGAWHLWVYCCNWSIFNADQTLGSSGDSTSFDSATQFLDGQALAAATTDSTASSQFVFDLGGLLTTEPYDRYSEQWTLCEPDGNVLSLRGDGTYCYSHSNADPQSEQWHPAWTV